MTISSRLQDSGALAAPGRLFGGFGGAVGRAAVWAADLLLTWQERARQRRLLASLDDRMLDDIGIGHGEVLREADKPFWRA
jgi:uncharacterized protein YjiS (DUF1127 family)